MTGWPDEHPEDKSSRPASKKAEYDLVQNAIKAGDVKLEITPKEVPKNVADASKRKAATPS